jgi:hypothetical protein
MATKATPNLINTLNQNTTGSSGSCTGNAATATLAATATTVTTNANLTGMVTSVGNATTVVTNANLTGMVTSVGNATTVVTNANLTGVITSSGNATSIASQTGTGSKFVVDTAPTIASGLTISSGAAETFIYDNGNSGTSKAIAWNNGNNQKVLVTGAVAFTFTAPTNPGKFTIIIKQDTTGHVYSLPSIKWANATSPTLSTAAYSIDILTVLYDGTNYYGSFGGGFA